MTEITVTPTPQTQVDPRAIDLGYLAWNGDPLSFGSITAMTAGNGHAMSIHLPSGIRIGNVVLNINTPAAGTAPTSFFVGLCSASTMLTQSGNLAASASLTSAGPQEFSLSAAFTTTYSGLYYVLAMIVGTFSVTQPTFYRNSGVTNQQAGLAGGPRSAGGIGSGLTVLPTNGTAVTIGTTGGLNFFVGVAT